MRVGWLVVGILAAASLGGIPTASAHDMHCTVAAHAIVNVHWMCTATKDRPEYHEWCILTIRVSDTVLKTFCDKTGTDGNPFTDAPY